jgi:hypothetical protein
MSPLASTTTPLPRAAPGAPGDALGDTLGDALANALGDALANATGNVPLRTADTVATWVSIRTTEGSTA